MPKFFVKANQIENEQINIIEKDVNHIKNVLRKQIGDKIEICNQETEEKIQNNEESNVYLHIFQGLPKAEKMDLVIQKGVELGVSEFTPVEMKRCIVKLDSKGAAKKVERWQKISEVASKQSGRNIIPRVNEIKTIENACKSFSEFDIVLVAYEKETQNYIKEELKKHTSNENLKIAVVIGPEGGIESKEIEMLKNAGGKIITLGKRIMRTETVALQIASIIMYELEK